MNNIVTHELRPGDRFTYDDKEWGIEDYSTYEDAQGYQIDEWLLTSDLESEHYLLREFDSHNTQSVVTWYLASSVQNVCLFLPNSGEDIVCRLWQEMGGLSHPYPELLFMEKCYYFESQTKGDYQVEGGITPRITWDYWDENHQTNLAIEAFPHGKLNFYLAKIIEVEEITNIHQEVQSKRWFDIILALSILVIGILLMILG